MTVLQFARSCAQHPAGSCRLADLLTIYRRQAGARRITRAQAIAELSGHYQLVVANRALVVVGILAPGRAVVDHGRLRVVA